MRWRAAFNWPLIVGVVLSGCRDGVATPSNGDGVGVAESAEASTVRFVPLGDSYTIGTSVAEHERWPNQLVERVRQLELVGNPAVNGFRSADLITDELPQLDRLRPELVSVLIGVNDVVGGVPDSQYSGNVVVILEELLARLPPQRILCLATPDYTATPMGDAFGDPALASDAIVRNNAILREACEGRGIRFVPEIFEISREARDDGSLVADDGLHPSAAQYQRWVDAIAPVVEELLAG
jgi:lysophospholipase L1-like esterase